ncbi:MAG: zf-HC2 domain-containing protein [Elusimicrobiota bacterium]
MRCPDNEQWSAYADREAEPEEARSLEAHLSGCEVCRLTLRSLRAAKRVLGAEPVPAMPADLRRSLRRSIRDMRPAPDERSWRILLGGWLRPAAAFSLAAAALLFVLWMKRPVPRPTEAQAVPADLLLAAHDRFAMTIPLASAEVIVSAERPLLAGAASREEEGRDVY